MNDLVAKRRVPRRRRPRLPDTWSRGDVALVVVLTPLVITSLVVDRLGIVLGVLILAVIVGPVARWAVADPAPMSRWMTLAAGAGGIEVASLVPFPTGPNPFVVTIDVILCPILAAGGLVVLYRCLTWRAAAVRLKPLGRRWLAKGVFVSILIFVAAFIGASMFMAVALSGYSPPEHLLRGLLQFAAGVLVVALTIVAMRWTSSRWWARRAWTI
jgi:hypothetical protein